MWTETVTGEFPTVFSSLIIGVTNLLQKQNFNFACFEGGLLRPRKAGIFYGQILQNR